MLKITKQFTFDSAHKTKYPEKCSKLHGHTYKLEITISGDIDENGFIMDFGKLKKIVNKEILEKLDHKYLNDLIENPTSENIVIWIKDNLETKISEQNKTLEKIKLWETPTSFCEWQNNQQTSDKNEK